MRSRSVGRLALLWLLMCLSGCAGLARNTQTPTTLTAEPSFENTPTVSGTPALVERRQMVVEWPERIREKDSEVIVLSLIMDAEGRVTVTPNTPGNDVEVEPVEIADVYSTHNVMAVARLDIAGLDSWREEIREPLLPGKPVTFRWSIRAAESGVYRGVVWLYLDFVPKGGGQVEQVILLSRPIQIEAVTVLGLPGWLARTLGGLGLVLSTVLGYPFLQPWIERLVRRKEKRPR